MRQEINLHQPVKRQRDWLGHRALPLWIAGLVIVLTGYTAWYWHVIDGTEQRMERLATQVTQEREAVEALRKVAPPEDADPALRRQVESLEDEVAALRRLGEGVVTADDAPWSSGFASVFEGLARESAQDVWLKRIRAHADGRMRLEGATMRASAVPEFVDHLGREPEFIGRSFTGLELRRPQENDRPLRFVLRGGDMEE